MAELTNKRSISRAHFKECEKLKSKPSIQRWEGLIEQLERAKLRSKEKHVENLGTYV